ncbi:25951_t:CDS:2, partial [Gigaspora rosea]
NGNDPAQEPFLIAQKFEIEQLETIDWNSSIPHLNALIEGSAYEIKMKAWYKAREDLSSNSDNDSDVSEARINSQIEINPKELINPHKGKGQPKGNNRI